MASSEWYRDPKAVIDHVRLSSVSAGTAPAIAGYDDLVEIRRGGQGVVYSATQRSTRRRVAIKLLLDGAYATETARRRFEREIDLVATLRNPNIVRIYDSGVSHEGRPYFVMEYVDGAPLDRYVAESGLAASTTTSDSTASAGRARVQRLLGLFLPICEAVQHAHQRGVIHRDIKPANIRVDSDGAPRVLDFGLAKISSRWPARGGRADDDSSATGLGKTSFDQFTESGQFVGSLPWASPEHASAKPDAIDTRSDVYSLGVVLFQLMTGKFPYEVDASLRDVLNNISRTEPVRPSSLVQGIDPDVDTIVLKCLSKAPERRYQSAGELATDIRHYLDGEPIQARRDSAWYTVRKTMRRYQLAAAGAALITVVVIVALIVSVRWWRQAEQESKRADKERDAAVDAQKAADEKSEQVLAANDFLVSMLSAVDPINSGKDVRVAEILDKAAADVERELDEKPAIAVSIRTAIGQSYLALGLYEKSAKQLEAATEIAQAHLDENSREALLASHWLAVLRHRQGRYPDAEALLRAIVDKAQQSFGPNDDITLSASDDLARVMRDAGRLDDAEKMVREVIDARRESQGPQHRKTLSSMSLLATILAEKGRLSEAQVLMNETLELRIKTLGEEHPQTIAGMVELGQLLGEFGDFERSEQLHSRGYELSRKVFGEDNPVTLSALHDWGTALTRLQKFDEAAAIFQKVLEAQKRVMDNDNPVVMTTKESLGTALQYSGKKEEAEALYREAAEAAERVLGRDHSQTLVFKGNHALLLLRLRRYAEAEPLLRQNYESAAATLGEKHWKTAVFRGNLGRAFILQKRFEETEPHFLGSYEVLREALGPKHELTIAAAGDLVELYEAWDKFDISDRYREAAGVPPNP